MSGGCYNYAYDKLHQLSEDIETDYLNPGEYDIPEDVLIHMRWLSETIEKLACAAKDLEWFMSGDDSAETLMEHKSWKLSHKARRRASK